MVGRHLDEDENQTIWVGHAKLDQTPRLCDRALDDRNPRGAELSFRLLHIANLEPELGRRSRRLDLAVGELEVAPAQKEDDPAGLVVAELPHGVKAEDIAVEPHAEVEIARGAA